MKDDVFAMFLCVPRNCRGLISFLKPGNTKGISGSFLETRRYGRTLNEIPVNRLVGSTSKTLRTLFFLQKPRRIRTLFLISFKRIRITDNGEEQRVKANKMQPETTIFSYAISFLPGKRIHFFFVSKVWNAYEKRFTLGVCTVDLPHPQPQTLYKYSRLSSPISSSVELSSYCTIV